MTNINHNSYRYQRALGIFPNHLATERALQDLKKAGFNLEQVSVIVRNNEEGESVAGVVVREEAIGNKGDEGAATGAAAGGALGTLTGLLVGLGTLAIPGVGPILLAGAGATALATTLAGTAIGATAGSLAGGLIGTAIPEEKAKVYDEQISQGRYLVTVTGDEKSIDIAERIFRDHGIQHWNVYEIVDPTRTTSSGVAHNPNVLVVDHPDHNREII